MLRLNDVYSIIKHDAYYLKLKTSNLRITSYDIFYSKISFLIINKAKLDKNTNSNKFTLYSISI